jgi:hypothetical protein
MNNKTKISALIILIGLFIFAGCGNPATGADPKDISKGDLNTGADQDIGTTNDAVNGGADLNGGAISLNHLANQNLSGTQAGNLTGLRDAEGVCYTDTDNDGQCNEEDNDIDGDGTPNTQDDDIDGDGIPNTQDDDIDGDGILNVNDNDIDGDGIANAGDGDIDGDGITNTQDDDIDGDGVDNIDDNDIDGDGIANNEDTDIDGDGIANTDDTDIDGDGTPNTDDNDIDGDGIANTDDTDVDGDGVANDVDNDIDGDGVPNDLDDDADGDGVNDDGSSQQGTLNVDVSEVNTITVSAAGGAQQYFRGIDDVSYADMRQEVIDADGDPTRITLKSASVRASQDDAGFINANASQPIYMRVYFVNTDPAGTDTLLLATTRTLNDANVVTLGQMLSGISLSSGALIPEPAFNTFIANVGKPNYNNANVIIEVDFANPIAGAATITFVYEMVVTAPVKVN